MASVFAQTKADNFQVIVVDNDEHETARQTIQPFLDKYGDRIRYVHAPARNISIARNAVLDHAETKWVAFIDDDEFASYDWLFNLASLRARADIILGPVKAVYNDDTPKWVSACDFHSTLVKEDIWNAFTGNVMLDMDTVRRCAARFDIRFGKTGGEDTFFFRHMKAHGASIVYAENAVIYEDVPAVRATAAWILRRKYRSGQTHWDMTTAFAEKSRPVLALSAAAKSAVSLAMATTNFYSRKRLMFWLARSAFHAGVVSKMFGSKTREEYAVAPAAKPSDASPVVLQS